MANGQSALGQDGGRLVEQGWSEKLGWDGAVALGGGEARDDEVALGGGVALDGGMALGGAVALDDAMALDGAMALAGKVAELG